MRCPFFRIGIPCTCCKVYSTLESSLKGKHIRILPLFGVESTSAYQPWNLASTDEFIEYPLLQLRRNALTLISHFHAYGAGLSRPDDHPDLPLIR